MRDRLDRTAQSDGTNRLQGVKYYFQGVQAHDAVCIVSRRPDAGQLPSVYFSNNAADAIALKTVFK